MIRIVLAALMCGLFRFKTALTPRNSRSSRFRVWEYKIPCCWVYFMVFLHLSVQYLSAYNARKPCFPATWWMQGKIWRSRWKGFLYKDCGSFLQSSFTTSRVKTSFPTSFPVSNRFCDCIEIQSVITERGSQLHREFLTESFIKIVFCMKTTFKRKGI